MTGLTTSSTKAAPRLWRTLETVPGLTATTYEWRGRLGADYEWAKRFLRASGGKATSYPCPKRPRCGCAHAVVRHSDDDIVAVCRCAPRRCDNVRLGGMDIVLYEINRRALGNAIAGALGIKAEEGPCGGLHMTWQVGSYPARPGTDIPLLLTVQYDSDDFRNVVQTLLARRDKPFVLMAPTGKHWLPEFETDMAGRKARFLQLDELLVWDGKLAMAHPLAEVLGDYLETALSPARDLYVFECLGKAWRVIFQGEEKIIPHSRGMDYIAALLSRPNKHIHCLELQGGLAGAVPSAAEISIDGTPVMDDEIEKAEGVPVPVDAASDDDSKDNIAARMKAVQQQIEIAEDVGNSEEAARGKLELNALAKEMGRLRGYRGRGPRDGGPAKRAQQAVSKAIRSAQDTITKIFPAFGAHLQTALDLASNLRYQSAKDVKWVVRR